MCLKSTFVVLKFSILSLPRRVNSSLKSTFVVLKSIFPWSFLLILTSSLKSTFVVLKSLNISSLNFCIICLKSTFVVLKCIIKKHEEFWFFRFEEYFCSIEIFHFLFLTSVVYARLKSTFVVLKSLHSSNRFAFDCRFEEYYCSIEIYIHTLTYLYRF